MRGDWLSGPDPRTFLREQLLCLMGQHEKKSGRCVEGQPCRWNHDPEFPELHGTAGSG